ncbi:MAG: hypothetical protein F9K23_04620 [Bacteroidetes bacterium]|nr:MAG: hypothetical protein F9K23_04620 [Bacteroidota bacterium]
MKFTYFISAVFLLATAPLFGQMSAEADTFAVVKDSTATEADTITRYYFKEEDYKDSLTVYMELFGKNKFIPDTLRLPFFVALSYYPELYADKIEIEGSIMSHTMQARPTKASVFKRKSKRTYKIFINNRMGVYKGIHLAKLNFNMRVGFFGHELAHLLSYKMRNGMQLIGMGFKYIFSKKYKRQLERETDMETVKRGLGYPLHETKKLILHNEDVEIPLAYRLNSKKNYMTDEEVLDAIRHMSFENTATHTELKKY